MELFIAGRRQKNKSYLASIILGGLVGKLLHKK
jgi:hypothetical protein